jgi:hypothetical protein
LRAITPDRIRSTPGSAQHIASVFIKRLFDVGQDVSSFEPTLESAIVSAIKRAIPKGLVLASYDSDDAHNPQDRQLEIYTYINLPEVDEDLQGVAKLKILCRLSVMGGTLTLRSIQKSFPVEW